MILKWGQNEYTVAFDPLEGTVDIPAILVHYDAVYGELPEPTKFGYEFVNWKIEDEDSKATLVENEVVSN